MSEIWRSYTLGEVTQQIRDAHSVQVGVDYPLLGVRWYAEGPFLRETVTSETSKATRLYQVSSGQFIYNRMFAWKGAFGVVPLEFDGCYVSNEFPVFECDEAFLLPHYLGLWFQQPRVWDEVGGVSTGTTASRNRWKESQFADYRISLPPLPVQRRIVDLMAHLDNHLANLQTEREAAEIARLASLESRLRLVEGETRRLGDVLDIARGGSPRPIDDYFTDSSDGLNWIKIGDVPSEGRYITRTAQKIRPEGLSKTRQVKSGDFLLSNSMSFGRPYILRIDGCIHDGWLVLAGVDRAFEAEYLYFLLRSNGVQDQFRSLAAGSGVKNLNIKVVNSVEVVVPSKEIQANVAAEASAWMELVEGFDAEIASLRQFRQFLLSALLSRGLALPPTYDSFLAEVA